MDGEIKGRSVKMLKVEGRSAEGRRIEGRKELSLIIMLKHVQSYSFGLHFDIFTL